jgi:hypothetical protein
MSLLALLVATATVAAATASSDEYTAVKQLTPTSWYSKKTSLGLGPTCYPQYQSLFHWISPDKATEYSWDFSALCTGDTNYTFYTPEGYLWTIMYAIGGNLSTFACNPRWSHTFSHGSIIQLWGDPNGASTTDPETGATVPVTPDCEILGHTRPELDFIDNNNVATGGVILRFSSLPPTAADPDSCPTDPRTGYPKERNVDVYMLCDPSVPRTDTVPVSFIEVKPPGTSLGTCSYALTVRSGAACAFAGDPFDTISNTPTGAVVGSAGPNFGFVILGACLFVGLQVGFRHADNAGWLDRLGGAGKLLKSMFGGSDGGSGGSGKTGFLPLSTGGSYGST